MPKSSLRINSSVGGGNTAARGPKNRVSNGFIWEPSRLKLGTLRWTSPNWGTAVIRGYGLAGRRV